MSYLPVYQVVREAERQNAEIRAELGRLETAERENRELQKQADQELENAWRNLTQQMVPSLDARALDQASQGLQLPAISSSTIFAEATREQQKWQQEMARVEADPRYKNREGKLLEVSVRMRELQDVMAPLLETVEALNKEPMFPELLTSGYGTDAYIHGWYTLSYYKHWKHGDIIVEKYGPKLKVEDFGALRMKFLDERNTLRSLQSAENSLKTEKTLIERLVKQHETAQQNLKTLPDTTLVRVRALVREHVSALSEQDRVKLMGGNEGAVLAVKRISGVEAKKNYLEQLRKEMVAKPKDRKYLAGQLAEHIKKLDETKFDLDDLQGGIHELRRQLRWIPLTMLSSGGVFQLNEEQNPLPKLKSLLKDKEASSPFAQMPSPEREREPVELSKSLYLANSKLIAQLGGLKDDGEWVDYLAEAWHETGMPLDQAREKTLKLLGRSSDTGDVHVKAKKAWNEFKDAGVLKALRKELENV